MWEKYVEKFVHLTRISAMLGMYLADFKDASLVSGVEEPLVTGVDSNELECFKSNRPTERRLHMNV